MPFGATVSAVWLYQAALVLCVVIGIYAVTAIIPWKFKRRLMWWLVTALMLFGAAGASTSLLRGDRLSLPTLES